MQPVTVKIAGTDGVRRTIGSDQQASQVVAQTEE